MCKILPRIKEMAEKEGITIGALERAIGASKGVLSRAISNGTDIQSKWLQAIVENYPHYSAQWLLTGEGEMLRETTKPLAIISAGAKIISTTSHSEEALASFTEATKKTPGAIPLVSEKAVGGFSNEHFSIQERDVLAYYVIPKFRYLGVDFMIEVIGDSMIPKFYPGDIIACSTINHLRFIEWNKCHLIATIDRGLIIKRIMPCDDNDFLTAVSDNKDYPPFDIPKEEITGVARIVGVIHLE